jgi:DNA-binding MarR family transcriptional regulator
MHATDAGLHFLHRNQILSDFQLQPILLICTVDRGFGRRANLMLSIRNPSDTKRDCMDETVANDDHPSALNRQAAALLELFYPIHYRGNMAVEDAMRADLTRKQAAILWLIRSVGSDHGRSMRRKEIVARLQDWFDITSPAVTQSLRQMATPPLSLVRVLGDAESAREKRVLLTAKGERFVAGMAARGRAFLSKLVEQLPAEQVSSGVEFLHAAIAAADRIDAREIASGAVTRKSKPRPRRSSNGRPRSRRQESAASVPESV